MQRLSLILGLEMALAMSALYLSALPWPLKIIVCIAILIFSRVPCIPSPSSKTVMSSWGIFHQGIAYFPHQFESKTQYHDYLLDLKFFKKAL